MALSWTEYLQGMGPLLPDYITKGPQYESPLDIAAAYEKADVNRLAGQKARAEEEFLRESQDIMSGLNPEEMDLDSVQKKMAAAMARAGKWQELDTLQSREQSREERKQRSAKAEEDRRGAAYRNAKLMTPDAAAAYLEQYAPDFPGVELQQKVTKDPQDAPKVGTLYNASGEAADFSTKREEAEVRAQGYRFKDPFDAMMSVGPSVPDASAKAAKPMAEQKKQSGMPTASQLKAMGYELQGNKWVKRK